MTVYVVQENDRNIMSATEYGDLQLLLPRSRQVTLDSSYVCNSLRSDLATFGPDDHLLAQGDPAAIAIASYLAAKANNGVFNILKWINTDHAYTTLEVDTGVLASVEYTSPPKNSRVFACQETSVDLSSAERFGDVETLVKSDRDAILSIAPVVRQLSRRLANFDDADYILLVGDPVAVGVVSSIALTANKGRAKFLKWDRNQQTYFSIQVDVSRT